MGNMMATTIDIPEQLSLNELGDRCRQETENYRRGKPSNQHYCLEIFRRALNHTGVPGSTSSPMYVDENARGLLIRVYSPYIRSLLMGIPSISLEDSEQQFWVRYWQAANRGLSFTSIAAALDYFKAVSRSIWFEAQRQEAKRRCEESLQLISVTEEEQVPDENSDLFTHHARRRIQARYQELLTDEEYQIFRLRYSLGLKPKEIAQGLTRMGQAIGGRPPTARAVSDALERICRRMSQDSELQDLLRSD